MPGVFPVEADSDLLEDAPGIKRKFRRGRPDRWGTFSFLVVSAICLPIAAVLIQVGQESESWDNLVKTVLGGYLLNTLILVVGVALVACLVAVPTAWLVTCFEFPGRRILSWALVLPLAFPTYVAAFVFYQGSESAIPFLIWVRNNWGIETFLTFESIIRYGILIVMMAAVLYPYIYLACRSSFAQQGRTLLEAARVLGDSPRQVFFRVGLPMARPGMVAGVALVIMEVINDYGAVHFFGVPTLTEGMFRTWFGMGDKVAALRLASIVMVSIAILLAVEQLMRGRAQYVEIDDSSAPLARVRLSGFRSWLAAFVCLLPLAIGFLYPFGKMVRWAWLHLASDAGFLFSSGEAIARGTGLAAATAIFMPLLAAVFAYAVRQRENQRHKLMDRLAGLGYATPGAVIAVGVLVVFGTFDRWDVPFIPLLSGSLLVIGFAYVVRFFAIPLQFSRAGMERIGKPVEEASRLLGHGPLATFLRVDLPLLKGPLIAAGMLLFVDILKELPLTLILRPANFETLATTAFSLAKESRLQACAVPSLMIVLAGAIGLLVMNRWMVKPSLND